MEGWIMEALRYTGYEEDKRSGNVLKPLGGIALENGLGKSRSSCTMNCVQAAAVQTLSGEVDAVLLGDTKTDEVIRVSPSAYRGFMAAIKQGELDYRSTLSTPAELSR